MNNLQQEFPEGNVPLPGDSERTLLIKILNNQNGVPARPPATIAPGTVDPEGVVFACPGQTYLNLATKKFWALAAAVPSNTGWIQLICFLVMFNALSCLGQATQGVSIRASNGTATNLTAIGGQAIGPTPTDPTTWLVTNQSGFLQFQYGLSQPLSMFPNGSELASFFASNVFGKIFGIGTPSFIINNNGNIGILGPYTFATGLNPFQFQDVNNITFPWNEWVLPNANVADVTTNETHIRGFNVKATLLPVTTNFDSFYEKWHGNEAIIDTNHLGVVVLAQTDFNGNTIVFEQMNTGIRPGDPNYRTANWQFAGATVSYGAAAFINNPCLQLVNSSNFCNLAFPSDGQIDFQNFSNVLQHVVVKDETMGEYIRIDSSGGHYQLKFMGGNSGGGVFIENSAWLLASGSGSFGSGNAGNVANATNVVEAYDRQGTPNLIFNVATNGNTYLNGALNVKSNANPMATLTTNGQFSRYDNSPTAGQGVDWIVGATNIPAATASATLGGLGTTPAQTNLCELSGAVTVVASTAGTLTITLGWTDDAGNAQSVNMVTASALVAGTPLTFTPYTFITQPSSVVKISTTRAGTSATYTLRCAVKVLQ